MYNVSASHTSTVEDLAGNRSTCRAAVQASTCTVIEKLGSDTSFCTTTGYCACGSAYCPSGQWVDHRGDHCYASTTEDGSDTLYHVYTWWDCYGYKTYTRNASKCGYHIS